MRILEGLEATGLQGGRNLVDMLAAYRKSGLVRDIDVDALRSPYPVPLRQVPDDRRLNSALNLGITSALDLADAIMEDLDQTVGGIGWWRPYDKIDRQERILISDHLLSCARSIYTNISESYAYRLELDHALEIFRSWIEPGAQSARPVIPFPKDAYEDLSYVRVTANLTGIFRAFASALDCIGACIVGVAGLPTDIVKADLKKAFESSEKASVHSPRLQQLRTNLVEAESAAGPVGWVGWLLAMRNMLVHRGRRTFTCTAARQPDGHIDGFGLVLPRAPELTDVQAWVYAGGQVASSFEAPANLLLARLSESTSKYIEDVSRILLELWRERRSEPSLITQPKAQWKQPSDVLINPIPPFNGFELGLPEPYGTLRGVGVSDELSARMRAAGITVQDVDDVRPSPNFWS